jgi:anti-sigma factor RsiW
VLQINVYEWPAATAGASAAQRESRRNGYTVLRWTAAGMHYLAVSDVDPAALREFAADLRRGAGTGDAR